MNQAAIPKLLTANRYRVDKTGPSITTREDFTRRFKEFTGGIFEGFDWYVVYRHGSVSS